MSRVKTALPAEPSVESVGEIPFDNLPSEMVIRVFDVAYGRIRTPDGGDMLVTRYGWPFLRCLMPENWYAERRYAEVGEKLPGSTGHVYRVPTRPVCGRSIDLVVKFSRVAQEVPLEIATTFPDKVSPEDVARARFNGPVEEFGMVMELRRGLYGPRDVRLLTHRPMAIYAPPEQMELWQSGRSRSRFRTHQRMLAVDQGEVTKAIELDIKRPYVLIYSWLKGLNAEDAYLAGLLSEHELHALSVRVIDEMRAKGFRVLDNKPKHFILRRRGGDGPLLRHDGRLCYGLVDFELLERTEEYHRRFKSAQRAKYWSMQIQRLDEPPAVLPAHLRTVKVFGVNYIFGVAPNGGKIWTIGSNSDLFDYFLPDRWRRTPRFKLSPTNEVYRTRTRDNIHVVYRRSRMGEIPRGDPYYPQARRIREHGYNSPFEEVAIAEHLRKAGIATTYPRAIYRTEHESTRVGHVRDHSRFVSHADLRTPEAEPEPLLSREHDYYTIWGCFRGIDPQKHYRRTGHWGFIDVEKAYEDGLLSEQVYDRVVTITRARLASIGVLDEAVENSQFLLRFSEYGTLRRTGRGDLEVTWCLSALKTYEQALIGEAEYHRVIEMTDARIRAAACEALDLSGAHLLLSLDPDGRVRRDDNGEIEVTLCNFELIRMLCCDVPMRTPLV